MEGPSPVVVLRKALAAIIKMAKEPPFDFAVPKLKLVCIEIVPGEALDETEAAKLAA